MDLDFQDKYYEYYKLQLKQSNPVKKSLLVITNKGRRTQAPKSIRGERRIAVKIMVCFDCSDNAQMALDRTVEMFKPQKPEIIILSVVEASRDASVDSEVIFNRWEDERRACLQGVVSGVAANGLDVDAILAVGDPREMITRAIADKKPDMLVVGKRGGGKLTGMVLGSVSAYLVRHVKCPVLVFHQEGG